VAERPTLTTTAGAPVPEQPELHHRRSAWAIVHAHRHIQARSGESAIMLISRTSILSSRLRYGAVAQLFHWLTVVLVGTAYILSPGGREERVYSAAVDSARQTHETIGILVFVLVLLRILWRLFQPTPEPAPVAPWMKYSASAAHVALYALLVTIPLTAIAGAWLEAHPVTVFGIGNVGPMPPQAHDLGQSIAYIHTILGNVIIWLAGFHATAALFHHFVLRDDTLISMLPDWKGSSALGSPAGEIPE
jgi:cytochrome b561